MAAGPPGSGPVAAALKGFHPAVATWFRDTYDAPTRAQEAAWPLLLDGRSVLLLAPTGSGKTLAAFLAAIESSMFAPEPPRERRCRVLYVSPIKALAVDVERNLRAPLVGIRRVAERTGEAHRTIEVGVRSGDTPQGERARMLREPPDVLITTPESLYLMLTSKARETLRGVETVIVDEIHHLAGTKRGAHLFLSLERLEALRDPDARPLQRIGLSATQRPLDEIARLLGGATAAAGGGLEPRPVEIVDASTDKAVSVRVEVAVEDMRRLGEALEEPDGALSAGPARASIWPALQARLIELIRARTSTMIFVNSRRLAERLATAINERAEEDLARAHHGSMARDVRAEVEDALKRGALRAIVATSSLELGIDMGAVDLVIQVEAPPSVASGLQRIGRAGHAVGALSEGVVLPKFRGDLLACAAAVRAMLEGRVEETRYPRNPLDVLAQHLVAIVAMDEIGVDEAFDLVRGAAPFHELPRASFERVLDMLSGRYPSEEFSDLKPRITWDRAAARLAPRRGAQRIAVVNGGTITDRGLYGVFLAGEARGRVGELDEEMVFESHPGDVFVLGASSWRIEEITHDQVRVTPAPGQPGKMPFWRGEGPGRPLDFGRAIGALARELVAGDRETGRRLLIDRHGLDDRAADNLIAYLDDQRASGSEVPTDRRIVIERFVDEVGDWRVVILTPFGARVHAPWAIAVASRLAEESPLEIDRIWSDDGIVFRLPGADEAPDVALFVPTFEDVEERILAELGGLSLFAARFRESASRALLLPRRSPAGRTPLWLQRRRSADLLAAARRFSDFPIVLEAYRECLRDVFDLPALRQILKDVAERRIKVASLAVDRASPFASSLMFAYTAAFLYGEDVPMAERRAQTLALDHAQLRELLGEAELRELLDPDAIEAVERELQRLDEDRAARHADALHDLLLALGPLTRAELRARCAPPETLEERLDELERARRVLVFRRGDDEHVAAIEDAGRLRDALGVTPPRGTPAAHLDPRPTALEDLVLRHARSHGPFAAAAVATRLGVGEGQVLRALEALAARGRVLEGGFLPGGTGREWCEPEVLRRIKRRSLARARREIEPAEPDVLARFLVAWQGVGGRTRGPDAILDALERLQGAPILASELESEVLPARVADYRPADLDALCAAGEVAWRGLEAVGPHDGRIALYLADHEERLAPEPREPADARALEIEALLESRGAVFFAELARGIGGFPPELVDLLWDLVWAGRVRNDTLAPLRSRLRAATAARRAARARSGRTPAFRSRRSGPPGSEGRWSIARAGAFEPTERAAARTRQLLERVGIVTREHARTDPAVQRFTAIYPVLKAMEESGAVQRAYFLSGLGGAQFALPAAVARLRAERERPEDAAVWLAASDPAQIHGAIHPWPAHGGGSGPKREAGARVLTLGGRLAAWLSPNGRRLITFIGNADGEGGTLARIAVVLVEQAASRGTGRHVIETIDGAPAREASLAAELIEAGYRPLGEGLAFRKTD